MVAPAKAPDQKRHNSVSSLTYVVAPEALSTGQSLTVYGCLLLKQTSFLKFSFSIETHLVPRELSCVSLRYQSRNFLIQNTYNTRFFFLFLLKLCQKGDPATMNRETFIRNSIGQKLLAYKDLLGSAFTELAILTKYASYSELLDLNDLSL